MFVIHVCSHLVFLFGSVFFHPVLVFWVRCWACMCAVAVLITIPIFIPQASQYSCCKRPYIVGIDVCSSCILRWHAWVESWSIDLGYDRDEDSHLDFSRWLDLYLSSLPTLSFVSWSSYEQCLQKDHNLFSR